MIGLAPGALAPIPRIAPERRSPNCDSPKLDIRDAMLGLGPRS